MTNIELRGDRSVEVDETILSFEVGCGTAVVGGRVTTNLCQANGKGDLRGKVLGFAPHHFSDGEMGVVVKTFGKYAFVTVQRESTVLA